MRYPTGGGLTAAERQRREAVRMAAADDFDAGATTAQVARKHHVTRMSAWRWHHDYQAGGRQALESRGPASRCRLSEYELDLLDQLLDAGPAVHGYEDQRWTLERICALTRQYFGVSYSLKGMELVLRRMGWSVQVPARHAAERDPEAVREWKEREWPLVKRPSRSWGPGSPSKTRPGRAPRPPGPAPGAGADAPRW